MLSISKIQRGTSPVKNNSVFAVLKSIKTKEILKNGVGNKKLREDFCKVYYEWINNCTTSPVIGLDKFPNIYFSNGVTQAYDIFFYKHSNSRFRVLRGEYPYTQLSVDNWRYIEDTELCEGDVVILTYPFYENGGVPRDFQKILDQCLELRIPVMIDAAYFGTCYSVNFDYSHPAIEIVGLSLSKPFSIASYRCGILFSKKPLGFLEEIQIRSNYFNKVGAYVGLKLMRSFSSDYMPLAYRFPHQEICKKLNLLPTQCIMLANIKEDDGRFDEILQDERLGKVHLPENSYRKVCVSSYLSDRDSTLKAFAKKLLRR